MGAEMSTVWSRSPFAAAGRVDAELLRTEGQVRFLLVRGAREGASLGVVGAIWVSEDGARGGVVPHPDGGWSAGELIRNHQNALERGWSPLRIFAYWRESVEPWGVEIDPPESAESLRELKIHIERA
ncbi:MAG: hypothetical protein ACRDHU_13860 [Actinomycetota bacterium]